MNKETVCHLVIIVNLILSIDARPANEVGHNFDHFEVSSDQRGGQSFSYKTKDGQWRDETVEVDAATGKLVISGWYRYVGTDGEIYQVKYVADENGFRPLGTHLPGADLSDPSVFGVFTPLADGISKTVLLSLVG
ncbi:larval cuticle protein 65Ag1-like [Anopheles ziemanni]|uniref:larval cuticle protein 65Ag1-like n=1 Tax=Anopheles coustani TaxID=139045 RepID=UPI00265997CA|nr:larval cuticle protein 65Ag1-like [Anopheles coustani]XP_058177970.1 larval cuticle protein 65Ag1-like [Anopheles ziemanni]